MPPPLLRASLFAPHNVSCPFCRVLSWLQRLGPILPNCDAVSIGQTAFEVGAAFGQISRAENGKHNALTIQEVRHCPRCATKARWERFSMVCRRLALGQTRHPCLVFPAATSRCTAVKSDPSVPRLPFRDRSFEVTENGWQPVDLVDATDARQIPPCRESVLHVGPFEGIPRPTGRPFSMPDDDGRSERKGSGAEIRWRPRLAYFGVNKRPVSRNRRIIRTFNASFPCGHREKFHVEKQAHPFFDGMWNLW